MSHKDKQSFIILSDVFQHTNIDPNQELDDFNEYLEALGALHTHNAAVPFHYTTTDPAEIMLTQWIPYTSPVFKEAQLEDFPEKMNVRIKLEWV
jgi:hypothetical protein